MIQELLHKLSSLRPQFSLATLRNKYVVVGILALLWTLFFDKYSVISQTKMRSQVAALEADKKRYQEGVENTDYEIERLLTDDNELEKYAREQYLLKKRNEDIFVIVRE